MRVLLTGIGSPLGTRVAELLAGEPEVEAVLGLDVAPPGDDLARTTARVVDPRDRRRVLRVIKPFQPTAIVHLGVYEPACSSRAGLARERTSANAVTVLGAAADLPGIDRMVVRSGLEVYGRHRGGVTVPDEGVPPDPATSFGRSLLEVERLAVAAGRVAAVPVTTLRLAPLLGARPQTGPRSLAPGGWAEPIPPSPLARYLRLPVVPLALTDPPFSVVHADDAARAVLAALRRAPDGALNVVGAGAVTVSQAVRVLRRLPLPVFGPEWLLVRSVSELLRAPIPDHLLELLRRGRTADGGRLVEVLGVRPAGTPDVIRGFGRGQAPAPAPARGAAA